MSRETYIFIINPEKAKRNLIKEIEFNKTYSISLKDFIERSNKVELESKKSNYNNIIEKIKTNFSKIRSHELDDIFYWLLNVDFEPNYSQEIAYSEYEAIFYNKLKEYGIELVYEFEQKDKCLIFMEQLGQFEYINKLGFYSEDDDAWENYEIDNNQFKEYLDYLLFLLTKIEIENNNQNTKITNIIETYKDNEILTNQVENSLVYIRVENLKENLKESQNIDYRRSHRCCY